MPDEVTVSHDRLRALERRVKLLVAVAVGGAGLGLAGLYVGLRERPTPARIVIEDGDGRVVITSTTLVMASGDGERFVSLSTGSEGLRLIELRLASRDEDGNIRLVSKTLPAEGDRRRSSWAELHLGGAVHSSQVMMTTRASETEGPRLELSGAASGSTSLWHTKAGPRVVTSIGGVERATVLQLPEVAAPAPASGVAAPPAPPP